ncbi:MAG: hypothetical protein K0S21_2903, partial [Rhizobiaceae bacterium]|nr:hypothetical protein [Rhizobiaceae bacterium]
AGPVPDERPIRLAVRTRHAADPAYIHLIVRDGSLDLESSSMLAVSLICSANLVRASRMA